MSLAKNMPSRADNTENYINFVEYLKEPINFGNSGGITLP
jgi:hypothetical protein